MKNNTEKSNAPALAVDEGSALFFWCAEAPKFPGYYAAKEPVMHGKLGEKGTELGTYNIHDARHFATKAECDEWIIKNSPPEWKATEHGLWKRAQNKEPSKPAGDAGPNCAPVAGSAKTYRLIEPGETIQEGDEVLEPDCQTWTRLPIDGGSMVWQCWMIGVKHNPHMMVPHRRPVQNNPASHEGR